MSRGAILQYFFSVTDSVCHGELARILDLEISFENKLNAEFL